jgi:hypothetical protein
MFTQASSFKKSLLILSTALSIPFVAYLLEPRILLSFLPFLKEIFSLSLVQVLLTLGFVWLRVAFYSGIYGLFMELISNQEVIFSLERFLQNVKLLWKSFLPVFIAPYLIHFFLFLFFPKTQIPLAFIDAILKPLLLLLLSYIVIQKKYLSDDTVKKTKIKVKAVDMCVLILLSLSYMGLIFLSESLDMLAMSFSLLMSSFVGILMFIFIADHVLKQYPQILAKFTEGKELILINPASGGVLVGILSLVDWSYPPVFVVLRALTPKTYRTRAFYRTLWHKCYAVKDKLVAITCYTSNCAEAYKIAKEYKKQGSKVIMGGPHVSFFPQEALAFCDSVVVGEVEGIWQEVLRDYEHNELKNIYRGKQLDDYSRPVHKELLNSSMEMIVNFIETTRGCKFKCDFCTIPIIAEGSVRKKPVAEVVELIQKAKSYRKYFVFLDNNIYNDPTYAKELFEALIPLNIKWHSFSSIDIAKNDKLLALAKKSGCNMFMFGFEVNGDSEEKNQRGKFAMAEKYLEYAAKVKKLGIKIKANFILGFESDDWKTFFKIWAFSYRLRPYVTTISLLTPFPGAGLYKTMTRENRISNLNWRHYDILHFVFLHKRLNHNFLSKIFFPYLMILIFFTTSTMGNILALMLLSGILFIRLL